MVVKWLKSYTGEGWWEGSNGPSDLEILAYILMMEGGTTLIFDTDIKLLAEIILQKTEQYGYGEYTTLANPNLGDTFNSGDWNELINPNLEIDKYLGIVIDVKTDPDFDINATPDYLYWTSTEEMSWYGAVESGFDKNYLGMPKYDGGKFYLLSAYEDFCYATR